MNPKGCVFLEEGINFEANAVTDCCISHNDGRGLPILIENYNGEIIDWEKIFEIKEKRVAAQKQETIYDCAGCYHLYDYEFKGEKKISEFHFSHSRVCNAKCVYCSPDNNAGTTNYNTYPIIKDLIEKGYYKTGGEATMQGGEPTLMQNFEELVDLFLEYGTKIRVHSSGIKYSEKVAKALSQNKGCVVISIDSATKETYLKIKRVDAFDLVCESIKKYAQASNDNVIIKYVLIPGYNDNIQEIDKFFKLMKSMGVKKVAIDIEVQYARKYENKNVSPHVYMLYDYFENMAKKNGIELLTYSFFLYVLRNRTIEKAKFLSNKIFFNLVLKHNKVVDKNISYL